MDWELVYIGNFWFIYYVFKDKGFKVLFYKGYSDFLFIWKVFMFLVWFLLFFIGLVVNMFCCK